MTTGRIIDLNADLGEGCGDDAAMLRIVTSANIACGAHAGDAETMQRTVQNAVQNGVAIGAHVSYPDREHFGRRDMDLAGVPLSEEVLRQIRTLEQHARTRAGSVRYVKAHGALYNRMAEDPDVAQAVIDAIKQFERPLALLTLPGSVAMQCAQQAGLNAVAEAFADRAYTDEARLLPRSEAGAVISDPDVVAQRAVEIAATGKLRSINGKQLSIAARTLCVHGDTPGAVVLAKAVRDGLEKAGLRIAAFA
ncbi:MAG TPA: 5-oxoprolinase subunit PxpA [Gammaproteobacteria bacterium]